MLGHTAAPQGACTLEPKSTPYSGTAITHEGIPLSALHGAGDNTYSCTAAYFNTSQCLCLHRAATAVAAVIAFGRALPVEHSSVPVGAQSCCPSPLRSLKTSRCSLLNRACIPEMCNQGEKAIREQCEQQKRPPLCSPSLAVTHTWECSQPIRLTYTEVKSENADGTV